MKRCPTIGFVASVNAETEKIKALKALVDALTELIKSFRSLLYAGFLLVYFVLLIVGLLCM
jgi:hypothetical protein